MGLVRSYVVPQGGHPSWRSDRGYEALVAKLMDPDPQTRRWAARDMLDHIHSSSVLVERLLQEKDVSVREVILTTLTCLGDTTAVRGLIDCLRSEDAALRNEAVSAMRLLPDVVAPVMQDLLHDADSDVRIFAVNILEALRHPRVEQWLCEVAEFDSEVNVCATAVDLLGEVGTPAALDALRKLKDRFAEEPYIQFAADLAISRIMHGMNGH